jgi:hypothetical protein
MLTLRCAGPQRGHVLAVDDDLATEVGDSSPAIMRSVVVLPQPEGPRMVVSVPLRHFEADAL